MLEANSGIKVAVDAFRDGVDHAHAIEHIWVCCNLPKGHGISMMIVFHSEN